MRVTGPNTVVTWPLQRAAPFFAKILTTSTTGDERAWAAMALSGSGDRVSLPVLRRVAAEAVRRVRLRTTESCTCLDLMRSETFD